ncbi:hypothetical protein K3555_13590 [Leisingera sp. M527]|uniref:hypothetical protein n=1 Tax=Leisingera sp. M527 TaxID=2867014 RepID=UPI0021A69AB3|nr:hypothetical protein [Leisingera sp. M527]UWQ31626.1 hypothetical protein K3555_13590 [Leisingera sp. M527]
MPRIIRYLRSLSILFPIFLLAACDTSKRVAQLEVQRLKTEKAAIDSTISFLADTPNPRSISSAELFVSKQALNEVLGEFAGYRFNIPDVDFATFRANSIEIDFDNSIPQFLVDLSALHTEFDFEVNLRVLAAISVIQFDGGSDVVELEVDVVDVAPAVRFESLNLGFNGFVGQLLRIEAQKYLEKFPRIEIPIVTRFSFETDSRPERLRIDLDKGFIEGVATFPKISASYRLRVERVLVLSDGLHFFGNLGRL